MILGSLGLRMGASTGGKKGMFVAVGSGQKCITSVDGVSWDEHPMLYNASDIVYADDAFVACGSTAFQTSPDAINWTARAGAISNSMNAIAYGNGVYVSASRPDRVQKSSDSIVWTLQPTVSGTQALNGAAYGNGKYVLVGANATTLVSEDTSTWTSVVSTPVGSRSRVRFLNGKFIQVGAAGRIWVSDNASTWTGIQTSVTNTLHDVAYANGLYVAVGAGGVALTSPDALTWTSNPTPPFSQNAYGIAVSADGLFVVVCNFGWVYRSENGLDWIEEQPWTSTGNNIIYVEGI